MRFSCILGLALAGLTASGVAGPAFGQAFPTRNVTIIVPFAARGPTAALDAMIRREIERWTAIARAANITVE